MLVIFPAYNRQAENEESSLPKVNKGKINFIPNFITYGKSITLQKINYIHQCQIWYLVLEQVNETKFVHPKKFQKRNET